MKPAGEVLGPDDIVEMIEFAANPNRPLETIVVVTDAEWRGSGICVVDNAPLEGWPVVVERLVGQVPANALLHMALVNYGYIYDEIETIDITPWKPQVDPDSF